MNLRLFKELVENYRHLVARSSPEMQSKHATLLKKLTAFACTLPFSTNLGELTPGSKYQIYKILDLTPPLTANDPTSAILSEIKKQIGQPDKNFSLLGRGLIQLFDLPSKDQNAINRRLHSLKEFKNRHSFFRQNVNEHLDKILLGSALIYAYFGALDLLCSDGAGTKGFVFRISAAFVAVSLLWAAYEFLSNQSSAALEELEINFELELKRSILSKGKKLC